jgi:hypothetical protein
MAASVIRKTVKENKVYSERDYSRILRHTDSD